MKTNTRRHGIEPPDSGTSRTHAKRGKPLTSASRVSGDRSLITVAAVMMFTLLAVLSPASAADFDAHIAELRKKLPSQAFTIVQQAPFVVVGDEPADLVRLRSTQIVKWAVDLLKRDYFAKDPEEIIDVWLFKDKESYEKHTLTLFDDRPSTPYGYYSQHH